jgi:membrane protease YdiL (CAAX protease family)
VAVPTAVRNALPLAAPPPEAEPRSWADRLLGPVPARPAPQGLDAARRTAVIVWTAAALLVLLIFQAGFDTPGDLYSGWSDVVPESLGDRLYWCGWGYAIYGAAPLAIILLVFRESPARYGLRLYLTRRTVLLYGAMMAAMFPLLYWVSTRPAFLQTYPLIGGLGDDWVWTFVVFELARTARFVCLEFFFRGYLLFGLEEKLGYTAIAVSTLPYGIIHFGKPFPEAMAALLAGAVLGFLALRTRTIVGGAIIHSFVGATMDTLAIWRKGFF